MIDERRWKKFQTKRNFKIQHLQSSWRMEPSVVASRARLVRFQFHVATWPVRGLSTAWERSEPATLTSSNSLERAKSALACWRGDVSVDEKGSKKGARWSR